MGAIPAILSVASTALGVVQNLNQGRQAAAEAQSQAALDNYKAEVGRQNAQAAKNEAAALEAEARRDGLSKEASQRARLAQNGILGSETATGLLNQLANQNELEALKIRYQGDLKAEGLLQNSQIQANNSLMAGQKSDYYKTQGYLSAGKRLIS